MTKHEDYFTDIKTDFQKANDKVLDEFNVHIQDLKESVNNLITITKEDFATTSGRNDVENKVKTVCLIAMTIAQIVVLLISKNYYLYFA